MDVGGRRFRVPGQMIVAVIALLLVASVLWNLRQHRIIERQRERELAAEREQSARAREQAQARLKKKAEWAASDARVQQLYREIDNLSRINERLLVRPMREADTSASQSPQDQAVKLR